MSKLTLATLQVGQGSLEVLNANFQLIQNAFDNTFSRDGSGPNHIGAPVDMNNFRMYNLPNASSAKEPVTLGQLQAMTTLVLYTPENHVHDWATQISNKPTSFTPSAHVHAKADVTGLSTDIATLSSSITALNTRPRVYVQASAPSTPATNDVWLW